MAAEAREKRAWQPREMRMVAEFIRERYPDRRHFTRVRLGRLPSQLIRPDMMPEDVRMIGVWRRWADAIVVDGKKLILIEAAIRPEPGDISKLELYEMLIPETPELAPYAGFTIVRLLVYVIEDGAVLELAKRHGVKTAKYVPSWLPSYLRQLYPRERRGPLVG